MIERKQIAYFDNAATTFVKPQEVHDFMHQFYAANSVNIGRGNHDLLSDGQKIVMETRKMLLSLFKSTSEHTAVFTATATEALNVILQGQNWQSGQAIYISPFEHNAVYRTVRFLEREKGIIVRELAVGKQSLEFSFDRIRRQFAETKPHFVIVTHVSNVCGNIVDIDTLGKIAKENGAQFAIDCAQSAGLLDIDINRNRADYIVFAGHKTLYGPLGCSGFICKKATQLKPLIYGGTGVDSANETMPIDAPTRFEAGSCNIMAIAGLHAALTWLNQVGIDNVRKKEYQNYQQLLEILKDCDILKIVGSSKYCTSIASCNFIDLPPDTAENILSKHGVIVRSGLHCAPQAHRFLGTYPSGTIRFSVSFFTDDKSFVDLKNALLHIRGEIL